MADVIMANARLIAVPAAPCCMLRSSLPSWLKGYIGSFMMTVGMRRILPIRIKPHSPSAHSHK